MNGSSDDLSPLREALEAAQATPNDLAEALDAIHGRGPDLPEPMPWPTPTRRARRRARPVDRKTLIWTRVIAILTALGVLAAFATIALMIWPPH